MSCPYTQSQHWATDTAQWDHSTETNKDQNFLVFGSYLQKYILHSAKLFAMLFCLHSFVLSISRHNYYFVHFIDKEMDVDRV